MYCSYVHFPSFAQSFCPYLRHSVSQKKKLSLLYLLFLCALSVYYQVILSLPSSLCQSKEKQNCHSFTYFSYFHCPSITQSFRPFIRHSVLAFVTPSVKSISLPSFLVIAQCHSQCPYTVLMSFYCLNVRQS